MLTERTGVERLSPREKHAYVVWQGSDKPCIAPSLNAKLFALWLNGKTCEEIRAMNAALSLGEVVAARVAGRWDERRDEHLDRLLTQTSLRVQQVTMETATFVCDLLAVASREHGERLLRYLQTGDEKELGDFRITSLGGLGKAIEILQKLTGDDRVKKLDVSGEVIHRPGASSPTVSRPPGSAEAAGALKLLLGRKE